MESLKRPSASISMMSIICIILRQRSWNNIAETQNLLLISLSMSYKKFTTLQKAHGLSIFCHSALNTARGPPTLHLHCVKSVSLSVYNINPSLKLCHYEIYYQLTLHCQPLIASTDKLPLSLNLSLGFNTHILFIWLNQCITKILRL
jgi:hypothetical protein